MSTVVASEKGGSKVTENSNRHYILMALAPMIAGIIVFTALSLVGAAGNKPPAASFTYFPLSPSTVDTIQFTDTSSDEDGQVVSWLWNFGDNTTSTTRNPMHQYTASGTYTATLTVTDDKGRTDEYSSVVNVSAPPLEEIMFQDFESGNGTPGQYFRGIFYADVAPDNSTVLGGENSVKMTVTGENGGTIAINAASPLGYLDLQGAQTLSLWVHDTQGNNTIQLRLRDSGGDGGSGGNGYYMWSPTSSVQNVWTLITWDLTQYPVVPGLDLDKIASIELYEWNPGIYYFDNVSFTRPS